MSDSIEPTKNAAQPSMRLATDPREPSQGAAPALPQSSLGDESRQAARSILNVAAYKFVALDRLSERKAHLSQLCNSLSIKGTILLTPEGINLFVSGTRADVEQLLADLRGEEGLADLEVKESLSDRQPHRRMLVKIKDEIIAFGVEGIDPARYTSPRISAQQLKQWLDEKKPVRLLDVRNRFEVEVGTFTGAVGMELDDFRRFPDAVEALPPEVRADLLAHPVVTFCTGGIRCEKAAPFLERAGFSEVFQLDGGILKYFEEVGNSHYEGDCFVFDQRVALNADLAETETTYCFVCQATLFAEDQESENYVEGKSCPHCWKRPEEELAMRIAKRNLLLSQFASPLPGSRAYENRRPMRVPKRLADRPVRDFLAGLRTRLTEEDWQRELADGRILREGVSLRGDEIVAAGDVLIHVMPGHTEPDVNADVRVIHEDSGFVVVHKPAPLPTHASGRFTRNTLLYLLGEVYRPQKLRIVHRLDANTSGVMVVARTREFSTRLGNQFAEQTVKKVYRARIYGEPKSEEFSCAEPIVSSTLALGARMTDEAGQPAHTDFRVVERPGDGTSWVEAYPRTGRTNQIRVHLWTLGFPVVGDPLYLPGGRHGKSQTLRPEDPPLCLHAQTLGFRHPETNEWIEFDSLGL